MCDSPVMMAWVDMRIREALELMRMEMRGQYAEIVPATELGGLRAEVEMLRAELAGYRESMIVPTIISESEAPTSEMEAVTDAASEVAEAAAEVVEAAAEVALAEASEVLEPEETDEMVSVSALPADSSPERKPWYERKILG